MINAGRMTARIEGDFVVFMIGMRINQPLLVHKWLPTFLQMPKMLKELYQRPELGLLSHEVWFSRNTILVQYWRSMEQLLDYAKSKNGHHLPAWQEFNQRAGRESCVGIWHETYAAQQGTYENIYVNMPGFGLGKAGDLLDARGSLKTAAKRLVAAPHDTA